MNLPAPTWIYLTLSEFTSTYMNLYKQIHLGSLGFTWAHLGSLWFTWVHLGSLGFYLGSLEFTWVHLGPLGFTLVHFGSLGFTWVSLGFTWVHLGSLLGSLGFTWVQLGSLGLIWETWDIWCRIWKILQTHTGFLGYLEILLDLKTDKYLAA